MKISSLTIVILLGVVNLAYAESANWVQTAKFTGFSSKHTEYFTTGYAEWRMNWTYTPDRLYPQTANFSVTIYDNEDRQYDTVTQMGNTTTAGTTYVYNHTGTFYLAISVSNVEDYAMIIEQNTNSIPEYRDIVIPLILASTALILLHKRSRKSTHGCPRHIDGSKSIGVNPQYDRSNYPTLVSVAIWVLFIIASP